MRNLKLQYCKEHTTGIKNANQLLLQPYTERNGNEIFYVVTDNEIYAVSGSDDVESAKIVVELPDIVSAEFLQLENAICVATGCGEVQLIDADTLIANEGTYCDVGIERMAWSPNQEVVAFVTKAKQVVVMTCTFDVIGEQPLDDELTLDQQFVNVGWGKKETQFHGTAGKQAAKQSAEFKPPDDVEQLPKHVQIAWRGDGAYFAVSYVANNVGRTFRVYDSEGKLQYMAEKWNGLQAALTWRHSGNWIALPQIHPDKSTIGLFEKNGLRHRELLLPFNLEKEAVQQLRWSFNSDILALHTITKDAQHIYLYTMGNYHWYLKQVLVYKQHDPLAFFQWDNRIGNEFTLHVMLESGKRFTHCWTSAVDCYQDTAIACVIDGKRLLLTDFSKTIVPPPMCQRVLTLDSYINAVSSSRLYLCVYTSEREFYFYKHLEDPQQTSIVGKCLPEEEFAQLQLANLSYLKDFKLLATHSVGKQTRVMLLNAQPVKRNNTSKNKSCYQLVSSTRINGTVNALTLGAYTKNNLYAHTIDNGLIYEITLSADTVPDQLKSVRTHLQLTQPADHMEFHNSRLTSAVGLITLRLQALLHIDAQRIDEDVTSVLMASDYLVYTKLNTLHFVRMRDRCVVSTRSIERGAKLVTCASDARLVLQLPRGNLEVICPRVLALEQIGILLQHTKYESAMRMVRKQRINLNIICDHSIDQFVTNVDIFLHEIKNVQWLCLFLSELQNEDYALGMYASNYEASEQVYPPDYIVSNKVEYICGIICELMENATKPDLVERYQMPIITGYVKLGKLEEALKLIWVTKETNSQLAKQLLTYLLYLVDVNELYNVALGTYNFGLVLFVAEKSQKDPKEYLPYLNELKAMSPSYRKFKINEHLKRYERALGNLAECGEPQYDQALEFIKKHSLYKPALLVYENQKVFLQRIFLTFADHLRVSSQLESASIMYERAGQLQQALLSAKHRLDWPRVMVLAQRMGESLEQVAHSLVSPLQQQNRHLEAYELFKQYGQPSSEALLDLLIHGHLYERAIYEAGLLEESDSTNLLDTIVKPALMAFVKNLESSLHTDQQLFTTHKQRLLDIRKKQAASVDDNDGQDDVDIDEADLLSDTSSVSRLSSSGSTGSRGTGKTFRSSKNRRKHERKLLSLKPGNPFEDIALIDMLHNLATKLGEQERQKIVRDTCKALLQLHTEDVAAAVLQRLYQTVLLEVVGSLDEIWIPELMGGNVQHLTGPNVDYLALRKEQRYALISPQKRYKPQIKVYEYPYEWLT